MTTYLIETFDLTMYYGQRRGIEGVNLQVEQGEVFGFLGPNGAGKTTTLRTLLDVIRPTRGRATIFGLDCQKHGVEIRRRVGYIPGELNLYGHMTGRQYLDLVASLRGDNNHAYRQSLCERLDLDTSRPIKNYSRGNKQKVGIVAAFMGQPDLLILDEPTTGLDPLVQQTVMQLVREAQADGRTVFFSSHILPEVQAVCQRVGIIREGRLVTMASVETLTKQQFHRIRFTFDQIPPVGAFVLPGVEEKGRDDGVILLEVHDHLAQVMTAAATYHIRDIETLPITLEEVFLTYYGEGVNSNTPLAANP